MKIEKNASLLLGDTAVSDIFINEYLTEADGDFVKVYIYCLFLSKHNKDIALLDLSKKTGLQLDRVKSAIEYFFIFVKFYNSNFVTKFKIKNFN